MQNAKRRRIPLRLLLSAVICSFLGLTVPVPAAAESGCVTCHLDMEMLKQTVTVKKGAKSAMQSGAG